MKITRKELQEIIEEVAVELGVIEGNAFGDAVRKAKEAGDDEFEVDGKTYPVKEELTAAQEKLPEPLKKAILKKQGDAPVEEDDSTDDNSVDAVKEELTAAQEKLPEPLKKAILKKQGDEPAEDDDSEDDSVEEEEQIDEGNAWGAAVKKAKEEQLEEFEFNGKVYQVRESVEGEPPLTEEGEDDVGEFLGDEDDEEVEEGNAWGDAVRDAKEAGDEEFEFDGKTYKVQEVSADKQPTSEYAFTECTLSETFARITGKKRVLFD